MTDEEKLEIATAALDVLACWTYAPGGEDTAAMRARSALQKIRGGTGRPPPPPCKFCGESSTLNNIGHRCGAQAVRVHTLKEVRSIIEQTAKDWVSESDGDILRRWAEICLPKE